MSLTRGEQRLVEVVLDRLDTIPSGIRREPIEYILGQLVNEERDADDVTALIHTLRLHMPGLPKLSEIER